MKPALRRQVLSEWRGYREPFRKKDRTREVADLVQDVMAKFGLKDRIIEEKIRGLWPDIVGEFLARNSRPGKLTDGTLFIQVLQPSIRYELEHRWKKKILQKLKATFSASKIREVRFLIR